MRGNEIIVDLSLINVGIFLSVYVLFNKIQGYFALDTWHGIIFAAFTIGIVSYLSISIYLVFAYNIIEKEKQKKTVDNVK